MNKTVLFVLICCAFSFYSEREKKNEVKEGKFMWSDCSYISQSRIHRRFVFMPA